MQLLHLSLPCSSSPSCLLHPLSPSGRQSQQPCLQRWDCSACGPGVSLNYQMCSYCHLVQPQQKTGENKYKSCIAFLYLWLFLFFSQYRLVVLVFAFAVPHDLVITINTSPYQVPSYLAYNSSSTHHIYCLVFSTFVWDPMVSVHLMDRCSCFLICPVIRLVSSSHRDCKPHLALWIRVPLLLFMTEEGH